MTANRAELRAPASLARLLAAAIDYAGLFPPAALDLQAALHAYARHRRGPAAWMLGRFVVPVIRLGDLRQAARAAVPDGWGAAEWRLSVTGSVMAAAAAEVGRWTVPAAGDPAPYDFVVDLIECPLDSAWSPGTLPVGHARPVVELTPEQAEPASLATIASAGGVAKIRTGGLAAEAIPPVSALAGFLARCAEARVPVKATAGLHHAVRGDYPLTYEIDPPRGVLHGFVNLLMAAALAWRGAAAGGDAEAIAEGIEPVLAEIDPAAFRFDEVAARWRDVSLSALDAERARSAFFLAFGSCSFDEPVAELRALGWLG